jgi:hypothetical protein
MKRILTVFGLAVLISLAAYQFYFRHQPKCAPWRNVTGYYAMCNELNGVINCAVMFCNGTTTVKTKFLLEDVNNSLFTFSNNQVINTSLQNQIIAQANSWAIANAPATFSVEYITFSPDIVTSNPTQTYAGIDIKVYYKKCTRTQKEL